MRKVVFILSILLFSSFVSAQDKNLDKLELLYQQENYSFAAKNAHKLISKKGYENSATAHLFLYLSLQQLHEQGWSIPRKLKPAEEKINYHQQQFITLDKDLAIATKYASLINFTPIVREEKKAETKTKKEKIKLEEQKEIVEETSTSYSKRDSIVDFAKNYIDAPYRYGGTNEKGFDCSGFACFVMKNNGIQLPRSSGDIGQKSERINIEEAIKGDLLFFGRSEHKIHHVGIVISEKDEPLTMIHASTSNGVIITVIEESDYWKKLLQYAGRVVN
ncbi:MAG: C40 family peptidase [Bacteroidia bacterium]